LLAGTGNGAVASETDNGDAEAAPAAALQQLSEAKLVVATDSASMDPAARGAMISRARIFAHTAALPRSPQRSASKPLFPVELPVLSSLPPPASGSASASPVAKPGGVNRPPLAGTRTKPAMRRSRLPLAPSAAEIRREIATRNGGPESAASATQANPADSETKDKPSLGARLEERATTTPVQRTKWPTHVDYSAGPGGPAGANTAGDRKGSLIEATGPQQGVIRNRW
jgi:hypothetical protein